MTELDEAVPQTRAPARRRTVQEWAELECLPVPPLLREHAWDDPGTGEVSTDRYLSPEFQQRELEKVWQKVWQMACRVEDIPEVGDTFVYEVAHLSVLVVRVAPDVIRAYENTCPHRGTQLRAESGSVANFRCRYHAMSWNLDGSFRSAPCEWDLAHVDKSKFRLAEVLADTWEGFVFINMDRAAEPLAEYLGGIVEHYAELARPPMTARRKFAHVAKPIPVNWKVAQEAFTEAYHVVGTHPQTIEFADEAYTQYDIYPGERHWSRMIIPQGQPSESADGATDQDVIDSFLEMMQLAGGAVTPPLDPEKVGARAALVALLRSVMKEQLGFDSSGLTDIQVVDGIDYGIFPNVFQFLSLSTPYLFRWRPYGDDASSCLMDVMMLLPVPDGIEPPPVPPMRLLDVTDSWMVAADLIGGPLCFLLDQDESNMVPVMKGMRTRSSSTVVLTRYQESRIRFLNRTLDDYLSR